MSTTSSRTMESPAGTPDRPATDGRFPDRLRLHGGRLAVLVVVGTYLLTIAFGVTTSSLGVPSMRQDPAVPHGTTLGDPRDIRSDEWQVETPLLLGMGATGSDSTGSPLAQRPDLLVGVPSSGGLFTSLVNFDGSLLRLGPALPVASLFAARWWLPWVLLFLALPAWLRRVGANRPMAFLATALVATAPAAAWWSAFPIRILGFAAAGCLLGMKAAEAYGRRRWWAGTLSAALAGLLLSRLASWYIPWSITLAAPVLLATLCWLVIDREKRRAGLWAIGVTGAVTVVLVLGLYWENWSALLASADTVYPGQRRSGAAASPLAIIFGAPGESYFQLGNPVTYANVSELSSAFTFCAVWALVVYAGSSRTAALGRRPRPFWGGGHSDRPAVDRNTVVLGILSGATILWLVWCTIALGRIGEHLPVLNRVPPARAAETVGFLAALTVCLVLSREGDPSGWRVPLMAAGASAAVTGYATSQLQSFAPGIGAPLILGVSLAVFLAVLSVTREPNRWRWVIPTSLVAAAGVVLANPVQIGVGDLRDSGAAQRLLADGDAARSSGTYWATDSGDTDALLIATGVPTLSGIQVTGPVTSEWERLDPGGRYRDAWNRGGASIQMVWQPSGPPVISVGAAQDQIVVRADPCDLPGRGVRLSWIVSSGQLTNSCLSPAEPLEWNGSTRYVYRVNPAGA